MSSSSLSSVLHLGADPAQARGAVILLHGRGSSGDDIAGLADALTADGIAFFVPSAPTGAWYPQRFFAPLAANEPALSRGLATVDRLVNDLQAAGLSPEQIGLAGFSQGACLAVEYAARHPRRYGFVAALSGALIGPLDTPRPALRLADTPVLLGCADDDAHIPRPFVEHSAAVLASAGADVTKQIYPGSAHTVFPAEIAWLNRRLAALPARSRAT